MTLRSGLISNLNPGTTGLISGLNPSLASLLLARLYFGAPVVQSFPTTAAGLAAALGDAAATPSYIWDCQETSGNLVDEIASEPLVPTAAPLQGQVAVGLDDGSGMIGRKAIETTGAGLSHFVSDDNTVMDSNSTSVAFVAVVKMTAPPPVSAAFIRKRDGGPRMMANVSSAGNFGVNHYDGTTVISATHLTKINDGAWYALGMVWDETAQELRAILGGTGSTVTTPYAGQGSMTNAGFLQVGESTLAFNGIQIAYLAAFEGASAEAIDQAALDSFWAHATDPTGLLTTKSANCLRTYPVAEGYVGHFGPDQVAVGYHSALGDTSLGLATNSAISNLIAVTNDLTDPLWVPTTIVPTGNFGDSPNGFKSATKLAAAAANDQIKYLITTVAATKYTLAIRIKEITVGATGRIIFYDETGAVELASETFTATDGYVDAVVTATTNGGQISSSLIIEIDTSGHEIFADDAYAALGAGRHSGIPGDGVAATLVASKYLAAGNLSSVRAGEITMTAVPVILSSLDMLFSTSVSASAADRKWAYSGGTITVQMFDSSSTLEDSFVTVASITKDTKFDARMLWDIDSGGVDGGTYETVFILDGTRKNGAAAPYDGTHVAGYSSGISLGVAGDGGFPFDGFIQLLESHDGPLPL